MLKNVKNVDHYISLQPIEIQGKLNQLRKLIKDNAPDVLEVISYNMPAYKLNGMLIYFAAHKNHIGLYPMAAGIEAFKDELKKYETSKGTVQFPHNKSLPVTMIKKIIQFMVKQNLEKAKSKKK